MCLPNAWSRWEVHLLSLPTAFPGWHHRKERVWEGQAEPPWASHQRSHLPSSPWWRKNLLPQVQRSAAWRGPPLPSPGLCAQRAFCCLVLFLGNHEDCSGGLFGAPEPVLAPGQGVNQNQSRTLKTARSLCCPRAGTLSLLKTTFPDSSLPLFRPPTWFSRPRKGLESWGHLPLSLALPAEAIEVIDTGNERWAPGRGGIEQFIFIHHPSIHSFNPPALIWLPGEPPWKQEISLLTPRLPWRVLISLWAQPQRPQ